MQILVIDNHDSFTYNMVNILRKINKVRFQVMMSDKIDYHDAGSFDKILFSPGPDIPRKGNVMWELLDHYGQAKSILGICLGFQAICMYFGGNLVNLNRVVHGMARSIHTAEPADLLFKGITSPFDGGLYHSWSISDESFPATLRVTARSDDGTIMAVAHQHFDIRGVQFHPESIMTPFGERMIRNWCDE